MRLTDQGIIVNNLNTCHLDRCGSTCHLDLSMTTQALIDKVILKLSMYISQNSGTRLTQAWYPNILSYGKAYAPTSTYLLLVLNFTHET